MLGVTTVPLSPPLSANGGAMVPSLLPSLYPAWGWGSAGSRRERQGTKGACPMPALTSAAASRTPGPPLIHAQAGRSAPRLQPQPGRPGG